MNADVRWRAFAMVLAGGFMTLLDVSIVNVALPSIQSVLGATSSEIQWIVAGYSLTFGLMLVPAGRFGDVFGRRRMFLVGLSGFTLVSLACGFAPTATVLAVLRLVQGAFAGVMNPQISALIQELFQGAERARAFGLFGMTVGVSTAIGPLLGGVLVTGIGAEHGWRSVFLINVPIGLVLVPLAARFLPPRPARVDDADRRGSLGLDVPGLLLIAVIVVAVMWPFVTASSHPQGLAGAPWWLLGIAAVLTLALVAWERRLARGQRPAVLPAALVRNTGFVLGATLAAAYFAGFTSIFIVVTMFYQDGLGASALIAGLAQMPFALASAAGARWSSKTVMKAGRGIVVQGLIVMIVAVIAIIAVAALLPLAAAQWIIPALLGVAGWGSGTVISPNQTLTLADVPTTLAGTAAGLLQTFQRLGGSMGLALLTTVYFARVAADGDSPAAYAHGLALSLALTAVILGVALAIALADARRRSAVVA
ncbi:MAG: MFS transporter [Arachnia sp.]